MTADWSRAYALVLDFLSLSLLPFPHRVAALLSLCPDPDGADDSRASARSALFESDEAHSDIAVEEVLDGMNKESFSLRRFGRDFIEALLVTQEP
jgi:hypothetical protein